MAKERYVLVTTANRGVFGGVLQGEPTKEKVVLTECRNCIYWSEDVKGFLGLADTGPTASCRIGPPVPEATLFGITAVVECTPAAAEAWRASPWQK